MPPLLNLLGTISRQAGDSTRARAYYDEALTFAQEVGSLSEQAWACSNLGYIASHQHEPAHAVNWFRRSLTLFQALEDRQGIAACLVRLAATWHTAGQLTHAARLLGAADVIQAAGGPDQVDRADYDRILAVVRAQLDDATFTASWDEGQTMTLEQAIADALEDNDRDEMSLSVNP
jgi:tetratricopeptide (TPR) repeat protein